MFFHFDREFHGVAERYGQQGNTGENPVHCDATAENNHAGSREEARQAQVCARQKGTKQADSEKIGSRLIVRQQAGHEQ